MISLSTLGVALKVVVPIICTVTENLMITILFHASFNLLCKSIPKL